MEAASQSDSARVAAPPPAVTVIDELSNVLACARETLSGFLELASLEARRAGLTLVWMFSAGLVAAVCLVTAWMGLMAALVMYVVSLGLLPIAAAIGVAMLNIVAAVALVYWCTGMSRALRFAATRRQLAGANVSTPPAP